MKSNHPLSSRIVTVEPMIFFLISIMGMLVNLRTQYLEYRIAKSYNYTLPNIGSADSSCLINGTKDAIQTTIEAETSIWVLYIKATSFFVPLFTATILSAASDYIGRKPVFILAAICHLIKTCMYLLVSIYELPLWVLLVAHVINGLTGEFIAANATALAYIVDIYPEKERTFRFVIMNSMIYIGFGISEVVIGKILEITHDFDFSFACAVVLSIVNLIYVCCPFFVPESLENTEEVPKGMVKNLYLGYIRLFKKNYHTDKHKENIQLMLVGTLIAYFLYNLVNEAIHAVIPIYGIAAPYCWTPVDAGIYAVMANMFPAICSIVAVKVMSLCLSHFWMIHISNISGVIQQLVAGFAKSSFVILYASPCTGFLRTVSVAIYNIQLSALVGLDEQGMLFGCTAIMNTLARLCSPLVFNTLYAVFAKQGHAENTFFLAAAFLGVAMIINGFLHFKSTHNEKAEKFGNGEDVPILDKDTKCGSELE